MSARLDTVLQDLLKEPFGPYLAETILSIQCKHTSSKRLQLENLMLSYDGKPTGFDRTEFKKPFVPSNVTHLAPIQIGTRVLFRGVLSVQAVTHLSDKGVEYLNGDFKERVMRSALNGIASAKKYSSFNMESIFELKAEQKRQSKAVQYEVRVLIQGYVHATASFMRSDVVPNGLLLSTTDETKNSFRNFEVVSLDIQTYLLSRVFLFRHHTLRTLRDILGNYKGGVLTHKRTPQWFLENYFHGFAYPSHRRWSRINSLEDAESGDEGSNHFDQLSVSRPTDAQTHRPRHLRVVHKNEVWSILASHAEWLFSLVQKHKDLKGEVNGHAWEAFMAKVPSLRVKALSNQGTNRRWGLQDELRQGHVARISAPVPLPKPLPPKSTPRKRKQRSKSPPTQPSPKRQSVALTAAQPFTKGHFDAHFEDTLENAYDSDFSQVSTASHHSSSDPPAPDTLALCNLLPPEMFMPPTLPSDMVWHCPVGEGRCSFVINMCSPSQDTLGLVHKHVSSDSINYLLHRDWKCNDKQVMMAFYEIVNAHWEEHLQELGIKHVQHSNASAFESIHPRGKPLRTKKWQQWKARIQQNTSQTKRESPSV